MTATPGLVGGLLADSRPLSGGICEEGVILVNPPPAQMHRQDPPQSEEGNHLFFSPPPCSRGSGDHLSAQQPQQVGLCLDGSGDRTLQFSQKKSRQGGRRVRETPTCRLSRIKGVAAAISMAETPATVDTSPSVNGSGVKDDLLKDAPLSPPPHLEASQLGERDTTGPFFQGLLERVPQRPLPRTRGHIGRTMSALSTASHDMVSPAHAQTPDPLHGTSLEEFRVPQKSASAHDIFQPRPELPSAVGLQQQQRQEKGVGSQDGVGNRTPIQGCRLPILCNLPAPDPPHSPANFYGSHVTQGSVHESEDALGQRLPPPPHFHSPTSTKFFGGGSNDDLECAQDALRRLLDCLTTTSRAAAAAVTTRTPTAPLSPVNGRIIESDDTNKQQHTDNGSRPHFDTRDLDHSWEATAAAAAAALRQQYDLGRLCHREGEKGGRRNFDKNGESHHESPPLMPARRTEEFNRRTSGILRAPPQLPPPTPDPSLSSSGGSLSPRGTTSTSFARIGHGAATAPAAMITDPSAVLASLLNSLNLGSPDPPSRMQRADTEETPKACIIPSNDRLHLKAIRQDSSGVGSGNDYENVDYKESTDDEAPDVTPVAGNDGEWQHPTPSYDRLERHGEEPSRDVIPSIPPRSREDASSDRQNVCEAGSQNFERLSATPDGAARGGANFSPSFLTPAPRTPPPRQPQEQSVGGAPFSYPMPQGAEDGSAFSTLTVHYATSMNKTPDPYRHERRDFPQQPLPQPHQLGPFYRSSEPPQVVTPMLMYQQDNKQLPPPFRHEEFMPRGSPFLLGVGGKPPTPFYPMNRFPMDQNPPNLIINNSHNNKNSFSNDNNNNNNSNINYEQYEAPAEFSTNRFSPRGGGGRGPDIQLNPSSPPSFYGYFPDNNNNTSNGHMLMSPYENEARKHGLTPASLLPPFSPRGSFLDDNRLVHRPTAQTEHSLPFANPQLPFDDAASFLYRGMPNANTSGGVLHQSSGYNGFEGAFNGPASSPPQLEGLLYSNGPQNGGTRRVYTDDRDRMVYVSWIPKKARAYNTLDKRRMELDLKKRLKDGMRLAGLTKVLLFPPKGVHCKLIFDTPSSAATFMEIYGGDNRSPETERWKTELCHIYNIEMFDKFDKTVVKIEWSQK